LIAVLESPVKLRIPPELVNKAREELVYEDKKVTYEWLKYNKMLAQDNEYLRLLGQENCPNRPWFVMKNSRDELIAKVGELQAKRFVSLLFQDDKGYWTYSGFVTRLFGKDAIIKREYTVPEWSYLNWDHEPKFQPRYYQIKAMELLAPEDKSRVHGAVEIGTGLGKTFIMAQILNRLGLPAVIMVPTLSIAEQMLQDMQYWFGKGNVGQFYDGKKQPEKKIVIAVAASLTKVEDVSIFQDKKIIIVDEGHTLPAKSFKKVCLDLFDFIPYRYFFSATMLRSDGLGLLLEGAIGDVLYEMTVEDGIKQGFLTPLKFFQYQIVSTNKTNSKDPIEVNRVHLHNNKKIYKHAAALLNHCVLKKGRRALVLVDTVDQYKLLLDGGLSVVSKFAHGPLTRENKESVPQSEWKNETQDLIKRFDGGEFQVLVGTSVIGMGVDCKSPDLLINLVGLTSEVEIRQGIGRLTRLFDGKKDSIYIDYDVVNIDLMHRHAAKRRKIYNSVYGKCQIMVAK